MRLVSVFIHMNEMFYWFVLSDVWMCYLPERSVAMCLRRSHHHFLQGTTESVLTSCITVWYGNCTAADRKTLQRTVNTTAKITGAPLPSILDISLARCSSKANSIMKDPIHPSHSLFQLLPSGRQYRSIRARSARLLNSFFPRLWEPWTQLTPAPLWNPIQTPYLWNMDHLTPQLSLFAHVQYLWGICTVVQFVCFSLCIGNHFYIYHMYSLICQ